MDRIDMTKTDFPTAETLRKLLRYNPQTGALTWLERSASMFKTERAWNTWNARFAGKPALTSDSRGYRIGSIFTRSYFAHRVAYAIYHGEWPDDQIDHINGKRSDNRIANLRAVTRQENARNMKRPKDNKSGVMGVSWCNYTQKWKATINVRGRYITLGRFDCFLAASMVRRKAETNYGFHVNHGRVVA